MLKEGEKSSDFVTRLGVDTDTDYDGDRSCVGSLDGDPQTVNPERRQKSLR